MNERSSTLGRGIFLSFPHHLITAPFPFLRKRMCKPAQSTVQYSVTTPLHPTQTHGQRNPKEKSVQYSKVKFILPSPPSANSMLNRKVLFFFSQTSKSKTTKPQQSRCKRKSTQNNRVPSYKAFIERACFTLRVFTSH